ncbi:MAG: response regulator [Patescibacteria group bacterium]|nr:response regulator [Patescibacteria group bacterium]MDE2590809.1 response regulator [Patescibacteria group bacterium]
MDDKKRVLVVEDEPMLKKMYEKILIDDGFAVNTASNGKEGLEKAKIFQPHVILLDLLMPEMTGFEFLSRVKEDEELKFTKVIVITNVFADTHELLTKGAQDVLLKVDYTPEQVVDKVREVLAIPEPKHI